MTERLLNGSQYHEYITGLPDGIFFKVTDEQTGLEYDFDGFANGHLLWAIDDYQSQFAGVLEPGDTTEDAYVMSARLQVDVRQGYPIMWCAQRAADVDRLRALLVSHAIDGIVVVHEPADRA